MCDADLTMPSAKRARIEIPSFAEVDLSKLSLKNSGVGPGGGLRVYPSLDGEAIRFNLTPQGWLETPYGFDVNTRYEEKVPSFLGGKGPENDLTPEGLSLKIKLGQAETAFLESLDAQCQQRFSALTRANWNPLVKDGGCKATAVLTGPPSGLTKIAIVFNGKVFRGEGWDFLEPWVMGAPVKGWESLRNAEVKAVVRVKKLWNVAGKAGLKLEATQLLLRATEKPAEADAFGDDNELL
jgi:hypothetical protein